MHNRFIGAALAAAAVLFCLPAHATVNSAPPPISYSCNGTTTVFSVTFPYLSKSDLLVTQTTAAGAVTTLTQPSGYTVTPSVAPSTGTLTLATACPSGSTLKITRSLQFVQPQSFRTGSYQGASHEAAFDRLEMQIQQLAPFTTTFAGPTSSGLLSAADWNTFKNVSLQPLNQYQAPGSTVSRTVSSRLSDMVSVKDFAGPDGVLAKGDGVHDDTAAIQAAYVQNPASAVYFPCGTYKITAPISVASSPFGTLFVGQNMNCATVRAASAMTAMFQFTDTSASQGFTFSELKIDGNHLAAKGIASTQVRHLHFDHVFITGTTTAAVDVAEGWDQVFTRSYFQNNDGDALRLGTNANNVRLDGNVISTNPGWGILITSGLGVGIYNNDISANEKGGIYMVSGSGTAGGGVLNVRGNYFEGNAAHATTGTVANGSPTVTGVSVADVAIAATNVGHVITGIGIPASTTISSASGTSITMSANATASATETVYTTVGATIGGVSMTYDVVLNGSPDATLLNNTFPITSVTLDGNTITAYGTTAFAVLDPGTQTMRVVSNSHAVYSTRAQNLFTTVGAAGAPSGLVVENNIGFSGNNNNGRRTLHDRVALSVGSVAVIDLSAGEDFVLTPTSAAAFTINNPINTLGNNNHPSFQFIVVRIRNALGGGTALGAVTWSSSYKLAAWTQPADGFSRTIVFSCDSFTTLTCVEVSRTPADVPN
jgi:hypothetical protein